MVQQTLVSNATVPGHQAGILSGIPSVPEHGYETAFRTAAQNSPLAHTLSQSSARFQARKAGLYTQEWSSPSRPPRRRSMSSSSSAPTSLTTWHTHTDS